MFASSLGPRVRRRGIVLVLILGMLGLVALIGVTFATFAGQSLKGSRDFMQGVARPSAEVLMDYALAQLINDTNSRTSALRGHSLLRDMYGNDSVFRGLDPTISAAAATKGHLDRVYDSGALSQLFLKPGVLNATNGSAFYNQFQYESNIPIGGQYYGLNFTRWILSFPSATNGTNNFVTQTFEILDDSVSTNGYHLFTLSNNLVNPDTSGVGIPSSDTKTSTFVNPNYVPGGTLTSPTAFLSDPIISGAASMPFTLDAQYMRAFNGPGLTRADNPLTLSPYPHNFAAYANFRITGLDPDSVGMDEDYDACDLENWFLAIQSADGQVIVPSFHRPGILMASDWITPVSAASSDFDKKSVSKILRPRQGDNSPLFPANPTPDETGKITFDIDNDGDGKTDSVWLDLGYPVQRDPGGKLYKPLFAFMVLGLNGRLPLNTAGNLQARAHGNGDSDYSVAGSEFTKLPTATSDPVVPFSPTGSKVAAPYTGAYTVAGASPGNYTDYRFASETWTDAPLWDHASSLGYSVNEINPKYALQNAPANAYAGQNGAFPRDSRGLFPYNTFTTTNNSYSQLDNAGTDVALTQLRNLLAGTVPTHFSNPLTTGITQGENQDTNVVAVDGQTWVFPNNLFDPNDIAWTGNTANDQLIRKNGAVPGRWGEPEGIPTALFTANVYSQASTVAQPQAANPIAPYSNPVRAGRSTYVGGANDVMDDDFDAFDPVFGGYTEAAGVYYPGTTTQVIRTLPEQIDTFDSAGQRSVASERIRQFLVPIDPSGTGRKVGFMQRPVDAHDYGLGHDARGRVGFFRYFRPAGLPQRISYPTPLVSSGLPNYLQPMLSPTVAANGSMNVLHGFQQALLPGAISTDAENRAVAVMGAMPFDWKNDTSGTPAPPQGYDPFNNAYSINTMPTAGPLFSKVNTDWGPNLGNITTMGMTVTTNSPAYITAGPFGNYGYTTTTNLGVVNGYLGGSLNKDEADEMNLYTPNLYDQPYGPSDLEWLYRKHDVDGASLTSRLSKLAPISFLNPADGLTRRRLFSTDSWDAINFAYANDNPAGYPHEQVLYGTQVVINGNTYDTFQPRFQFNSRFAPLASSSLYGMNQVETSGVLGDYPGRYNYLDYRHANPIATEFLPNPTLPSNPNPLVTTSTPITISNYYPKYNGTTGTTIPLPFPLTPSGTLFSSETSNVLSTSYYSGIVGGSVPVQTPSVAHRDRRINLNHPLPISNDPAEPVRQKWVRETYQFLKAILPPQSVDTAEELAALSQYVVNIIDFRDPDCSATRFVNTDLEVRPATDTVPAGVRFANNATTLPANFFPFNPALYEENPTNPGGSTPYLVQHGMEYNPIAINEALAYSSIYSGGTNNRFYLELVNTLTEEHGAGDISDISLAGWDIVVTPDAYGWGRPDPVTGDVSPVALPYVQTRTGGTYSPNDPPLPTPRPSPFDLVNGGSGLPGYIFTPNSTLTPASGAGVTRLAKVPAINDDSSNRHYYVMSNETTSGTVIGTGRGIVPDGAEASKTPAAPTAPYGIPGIDNTITDDDNGDGTETRVRSVFPDYAMPFGKGLTVTGSALAYASPGPVPPPSNAGRYYWVYLRRPANPFDTAKLTNGRPNREMVVVDSMRFLFVEGGGSATTTGTNQIFSAQRLQPNRGGHLVAKLPPAAGQHSPTHAYGYSEQIRPARIGISGSASANFTGVQNHGYNDSRILPSPLPRTLEINSTLGAENDPVDDAWAHLPFHDRDFTSVAELLLVPGCPPGLFTKQFVEEPYPGNTTGTPSDDTTLTSPIAAPGAPNRGRRNFSATGSATPVPSYPYLPDNFYYSAASVTPPLAPNAAMTALPNEVGGWTGAGWHKMMEFFEVPSSANGAIGTAANGANFDWYRSDIKPGLMNLNLIIDEEAFFGIIDDDRLNREIAVNDYANRYGIQADDLNFNFLPSVVTEIDRFGYPAVLNPPLAATKTPVLARYPISDLQSFDSASPFRANGRGFVYRDPNASASLRYGLKSAFNDFLKVRHGGSGYLFAFGSGPPGSGTYLPASSLNTNLYTTLNTLTTSPVASERPFHSLSFPDINYTIMRPASIPPSTYDVSGSTVLKSWSYPAIPVSGVDPGTGTALPANTGLENLLSYANDTAAGNTGPNRVKLNPDTAPNKLGTPYQYVYDPGFKNPYLATQYSTLAQLGPNAPYPAPVPPTPARRLFQPPDNDGTLGTDSKSNASLYGSFDTSATPVFSVNRPTSDEQLTSGLMTYTGPWTTSNPPTLTVGSRTVLMPDNQTKDNTVRKNFYGGNPTVGTNTDNRQHPLYRTEWLQKVMNLTTVRTHQFAVWITVGFFEVVVQGTPELGVTDKLGAELNSAAGAKTRYRSFFVLDRTRATGFNPYYPGDFRDVVTYRRRIE